MPPQTNKLATVIVAIACSTEIYKDNNKYCGLCLCTVIIQRLAGRVPVVGFVYYLPTCTYLVCPGCVSTWNIQIFLLNITYIAQMVTSSHNYLSVGIIPPISYVGLPCRGVKFKMNFNSITLPGVLQLLVLADCNEVRS